MGEAAMGRHCVLLPDTPYNLWVRAELVDCLRIPDDGTKVEVIGGEYVVSPCPDYPHDVIVTEVQHSVSVARLGDPEFRWRCVHTMDLDLGEIQDGYVTDLALVDIDPDAERSPAGAGHASPDQVRLVMEVTSKSNACVDRRPGLRGTKGTKWTGYARAGIPYYLLIDRDPDSTQAVLYSSPDRCAGEYKRVVAWDFGDVIRLPAPFGFEIRTDEWEPWE